MNKVKTRIGTYFISFLCGLGGNGGKCLIGGLARLAAVRETRRAIAPAKDEAAPGREPLHYVAGYPVKLALRRMGEEQSVGVVEKSPADILVVNREEVDVLVRVEGEHGPRRLHAPRIHAVVRQGICAAAARTRPSSWSTEPRFAVPMPTLSLLTSFETVWTRSQPLPVVSTVPAPASAVFVQVRPERRSPSMDGLLVAL